MGVVYVCYDRWDRRVRALKSFQEFEYWDRGIAAAFKREAELWIDLGFHPHVVSALTVRKPDGRLYLVLDYIEPDSRGRNTLSHFLREGPLPLERALPWAIQICRAMEYASSRGLRCHRDLKPDNIMIDRDGYPKVTDFGLAKAFDGRPAADGASAQSIDPMMGGSLRMTREGTTFGSPPWMPPEQFGDARNADVRSDVYSFGVLLYQMASGRLPYRARTVEQYATLHRHAPVPTLDSPINSIVVRCLSKLKDTRYGDFRELRWHLEETCRQHTIPLPEYREIPASAEQFKDRASSLCYLNRYEEALQFGQRSVESDPTYPAAWVNLSLCYLHLDRPDAARDAAKRAIKIERRNPLAWNNLACAYRRLGDHRSAITAAQEAVKIDREFRDAWNTLGMLFFDRHKYQEAVDRYRRAVEIDPFFCDGYVNLGRGLAGVGEGEKALECFGRAVGIDPDDSMARESWAALHSVLRDRRASA